jgi:hypothetical protein
MLLTLLPLLAFVLLSLLMRLRAVEWRLAFLRAAALWSLIAFLLTEGASLPHRLGGRALAVGWALILVICLALLSRRRAALRELFALPAGVSSGESRFLAVFVALILTMVGLAALWSPPNVYDAAAYHLPRILMWLQDRSVEFFPTHYPSQLYQPPLNEYLQLQFIALAGNDVLANCTQWFALAGCLMAVSLLIRKLGGSEVAQWTGAFLAVSLPQGILVASGAKNDVSLGFWLLTAFLFGLLAARQPTWENAFYFTLTCALALLTKGTAWVLLPAMCCLLPVFLTGPTAAAFLRRTAVTAALAALLLAPMMARNYGLYGHALTPRAGTADLDHTFVSSDFSPRAVLAGAIRNAALQCVTPFSPLNSLVERVSSAALRRLGSDPNDPGAVWEGTHFSLPSYRYHETQLGNLLHFGLYAALALAALLLPRFRQEQQVLWVWLALILAAVAFSAAFRWQPWHTRLHLPLFLFGAVPAALSLNLLLPKWGTPVVATSLLLFALPAASLNELRPLSTARSVFTSPRASRYAADVPEPEPYLQAISMVQSSPCRQVGLDSKDSDAFYYPAFALTGVLEGTAEVRYVGVTNSSARIPQAFAPCAVLCWHCAAHPEKTEFYEKVGFKGATVGPHSVFLK